MSGAVALSPAAAPAHGNARTLAGTGRLLRFILRRDRIRIPVWLLALAGQQILLATSYPGIYPTAAERQAQAELYATNPAIASMGGPGYGLDNYTYGAMMSNELLGFVVILVALMSVLMVVRHTRAEEESGRAEMVRATVVGRHAQLAAALIATVGTNLVLGLLVALGMGSLGIESITWTGSFVYGAGYVAVGVVFTGVAALTTQLTEHARAASGIARALIGAAYLLRAVGDMANATGDSASAWLSWLSPIGWAQAMGAYVSDRWWPALLSVGLTVLLIAAATVLSGRRDVGAGLVRTRPGRASASALLGTPQGFAWRLQRSGMIWWSIVMFVLGLTYGSAMGIVDTYQDNEFIRQAMARVGGATLVESFTAMIIAILSLVSAIFAVLAALRPRREETARRAEPVLATALSRTRWLGTHLLISFGGGVVVLMFAALGLAVGATGSTGDGEWIARSLGSALAYAPAIWVTAALAVTVFGLAPRAMGLAWTILVYGFVVQYFGTILDFPDWMLDLTPFGHVPMLPVEEFTIVPLLGLTGVAAVLVVLGILGFGRRDLEVT